MRHLDPGGLMKIWRRLLPLTGLGGLLLIAVIFQNCSKVQFKANSVIESSPLATELSSNDPTKTTLAPVCDPNNKPSETESILCLTENGNKPLSLSITKSRTVSCENGVWVPGAWISPALSTCGCQNSALTPDLTTGICKCPTGLVVSGVTCIKPTCTGTPPSDTETKSCPSGIGMASRTRAVTCDQASLMWQAPAFAGAWNYKQCSCSLNGQMADSSTGACACPTGQYIIGKSCGVCPTTSNYDMASASCLPKTCAGTAPDTMVYGSCPTGTTGQTLKKCSVSCNLTSLAWERTCPAEFDTSACVATQPTCTQSEVLTATKSYIKTLNVNGSDIANACVDAAVPVASQSLPEFSTDLAIRFFNTCGNRYCQKQGYIEGRVVEYFNGSAGVECRQQDPPPTVSDSCRQKLLSLPKPLELKSVAVTTLANSCIDSVTPTLDSNLPSNSDKNIRFIYTCGARWCRSLNQGFSTGRVVENNGTVATVNCYREEIFNSLDAGTIVSRTTTTLGAVANDCIDAANPTEAINYPSTDSMHHLRFINTCGNRYCMSHKLGTAGWIIEITPSTSEPLAPTEVMCIK